MFGKKTALPSAADALPGRDTPMPVPEAHYVTGRPLRPPFPEQLQQLQMGMGCFWGAERRLWETPLSLIHISEPTRPY